ncbi:heparinase II/III-family protein [Mucilaginibacter myungsuensis]
MVFLLIIGQQAHAQITPRNLLQNAAGDQVSTALIPQSRWKPFPQKAADWREKLPDSLINAIIKNGEASLNKPFNNIPATVALEFVRTGNRSHYEALSFAKRQQLFDMVLAETVEDKGRFTDHIVDGIWSVCEESFWGINAHMGYQKAGPGLPDVEEPTVDLFAAETAAIMAWTDYFVGPKLEKISKLIRPRIRYETDRRILTPMRAAKYSWMGGGNPNAVLNNWAPWIMANYLAAGLLLENDEAKRADIVNRAIKITDQYMNGLGEDGGCDEGPGYWFAAGAAVFDVLNILDDATGGKVSIYKEPFTQKMASYIYKVHIAGAHFIPVADAHPEIVPDGVMIYRYGKAIADARMKAFGSWSFHNLQHNSVSNGPFQRTRQLYNFFTAEEVKANNDQFTDVPDAWFGDIEMMISRTNNGLFVAAHAGHNGESHNHNDVGDFMVYADGYPVIMDVGSGTYTARTFGKQRYDLWFNTSAYHNVPLINGRQQNNGKKFTAANVKYDQTKATASLTMDIGQAYPATGVDILQRKVAANKNGKIEITDNFKSQYPVKQFDQFIMTICPTDISVPGKLLFGLPNGKTVTMDYDASFFDAKQEKVNLTTPEDEGIKSNWHRKDIYRITLSNKIVTNIKVVKYVIHR